MRTVDRVRQLLSPGLQGVHRARQSQLFAAVTGLVSGGQATLTAIGRSIVSSTTEKHGIKRADRCVGNRRLHRELDCFWRALAKAVLRGQRRPWILVDWTDVGSKQAALRAAVVLQGRAVSIFARIYPARRAGCSILQARFLEMLQQVLQPDCRPILVSDSGFQRSWFDKVRALGWDFVGRLRPYVKVRHSSGGKWLKVATLQRKAETVPRDCGTFELVKHCSFTGRIVTFDGRSERAKASRRPKSRRGQENKGAKRAHTPLAIVTSLVAPSAKKIIEIYSARMQIEETFRDDKSARYGWHFEFARSRSPHRLEVLLLLIALASLACAIAGLAARDAKADRHFQANTLRSRPVLSLINLGRRYLLRFPDLAQRRILIGLRKLTLEMTAAHAL